jgi:glutathione S-transferase
LKVKLYSIAISHPARAAGMMLRHKGIDYELVDIPPGSQRAFLRLQGFRGGTVPAIKIDGRRVQGTLNISRALDELQPQPPLFPADSQKRAEVEEAERWGEAEFQPVPRNIFRWSAAHDYDLRADLTRSAGMPMAGTVAHLMKPAAWYYARLVSHATEDSVRADIAALPAQLDHVDELIAAGVIGGEQPNAADFQIATTVRVLLNFPQIRPLVEQRPAGELAMRLAPRFGDGVPLKLPPAWVPEPAPAG